MEEKDLPWFLTVRNESRFQLHNSSAFSLRDAKDWWVNQQDTQYKVIEFERTAIGYFRLNYPVPRGNEKFLQIGCDIQNVHRRRGHAFNSYTQFMPRLLNEFDAKGAILKVLPTNYAAQALYRKIGFQTCDISLENDIDRRETRIKDIEMIFMRDFSPLDFVDLLLSENQFRE